MTEQKVLTQGLEKLDHVIDKTKRLILQIDAESDDLELLRKEVEKLSDEKKNHETSVRNLRLRASNLESYQGEMDERIEGMLKLLKSLN